MSHEHRDLLDDRASEGARVTCTPGISDRDSGCVLIYEAHGIHRSYGFRHRAAELACTDHNRALHGVPPTPAPLRARPTPPIARDVRAWGIAHGYRLRATGRIPDFVASAYLQDHHSDPDPSEPEQ